MKISHASLLLMLFAGSAASAQQPVVSSPASGPQGVSVEATPVGKSNARVLSANTPVPLSALEEVSSSGLQVGTRVRFAVAEDVVNKGMIVIPRGSPATGTISWKTGKAIGGKSGKFEVTFDEVMVGDTRVRLMGKHRQEGKGNTLGAVLGSIVISGRSAVMLPGQTVQAMTAEPIAF